MLKRSVYRVDFPLLEPYVLWKRINDREEGLRKEVGTISGTTINAEGVDDVKDVAKKLLETIGELKNEAREKCKAKVGR